MTQGVARSLCGSRDSLFTGTAAGITYEDVVARYPMWSRAHLVELRLQFQTFDIKQDGLIDFHEL